MGWLLASSVGSGDRAGSFCGNFRGPHQFDALDGAERYTATLEFNVDAAAQFASDIVLACGSSAGLQADLRGRAAKRLDAEDARAVDDGLRPGRIGAKFGAGSFEGGERLIEGNFGSKGNVDEGLRPITAQICHRSNVAICDGNEGAACVANYGSAKCQMFDAAVCIADLDCVSDDVLIFENDVKAGDDVADEILRTESDSYAGESGEGECWSGVDTEKIERGDECDDPDNFAESTVKDTCESRGLLLADLRGARLVCRRLNDELGQYLEEAVDEQSEQNNSEKMESSG